MIIAPLFSSLAENNGITITSTFSYKYDNDGNLQSRAAMSANTGNWYDRSLHHGAVALGSFSSDATMQKWTAQPSSASFHSGYSRGTSSTIYSPAGNEVLAVNNGVVISSIQADTSFTTIFSGGPTANDCYHLNGTFGDEKMPLLRKIAEMTPCTDFLIPKGLQNDLRKIVPCLKKCGKGEHMDSDCVKKCLGTFGKGVAKDVCQAIVAWLACDIAGSQAGFPGKDPCSYKPMDSDICQDCCNEAYLKGVLTAVCEDGGDGLLKEPGLRIKLTNCYAKCDLDY